MNSESAGIASEERIMMITAPKCIQVFVERGHMEQVAGSVVDGGRLSAVLVTERGSEAERPDTANACEGSRDVVGISVGVVAFCRFWVVGVVC
jgi:hypothetical protein